MVFEAEFVDDKKVNFDNLLSEGTSVEWSDCCKCLNHSFINRNQCLFSQEHSKYKLTSFLFAVINSATIDRGEELIKNAKLRKEIRELGIMDGKTNKYFDECGHIIAPSIGGKMWKDNLFPVSGLPNAKKYHEASTKIRKFVKAENNHFAIMYVKLIYGDMRFKEPYKAKARPKQIKFAYQLCKVPPKFVRSEVVVESVESNVKHLEKLPNWGEIRYKMEQNQITGSKNLDDVKDVNIQRKLDFWKSFGINPYDE